MTPFEKYRQALTNTGTEKVLALIAAKVELILYLQSVMGCDDVQCSPDGVTLIFSEDWFDDNDVWEFREECREYSWEVIEQEVMLMELSQEGEIDSEIPF